MRGDEGHCMGIVFIPLAMCVDQGTEAKRRRKAVAECTADNTG